MTWVSRPSALRPITGPRRIKKAEAWRKDVVDTQSLLLHGSVTGAVVEQARLLYRHMVEPVEDCIDEFEKAVLRAILWNHGIRDCQDMRHFMSRRSEDESYKGDLDEFDSLLGMYAPTVGTDPEAILYKLASYAKGQSWDRGPVRIVVPFYPSADLPGWLLSVGFDIDTEFDLEIWKPGDKNPVEASQHIQKIAEGEGIRPSCSSDARSRYSAREISVLLSTLCQRYPDLRLGNYRSGLIGTVNSWRFALRKSEVQGLGYTGLSLSILIKRSAGYEWFEESCLWGQSNLFDSLKVSLREPARNQSSYYNITPLSDEGHL